jgi:osmotically-inducible protein OsmY
MTDKELEGHVEQSLDWDPAVDTTDIGVNVDHGIVTLRGNVRSYAQKMEAERVVLRVYGVKAVANDLHVTVGADARQPDGAIAQAAVDALKWNAQVPAGVSVSVSDGWIRLTGSVDWIYQKDAAMRSVRDMVGVRGVTNEITVRQREVNVADLKSKIEAALKRSAEVDARRIAVMAIDGKIVLSGSVRSLAEREEAEHAAWAAPGVSAVDDRIVIMP